MDAENSESELSEHTRRLIAIGAAAAVNCKPCLEYHIPLGKKAGLSESEVRQAIEIGFGVNRGAHAKTRGFIDEVIINSEQTNPISECCDEQTAQQTGCC